MAQPAALPPLDDGFPQDVRPEGAGLAASRGVARRTVLKVGAAGVAALGLTGLPRPAAAATRVFRHGVASGDPLGDAVVLWTRVTPTDDATPGSGLGGPVTVDWEVATSDDFTQVVASGTFRTDASRDHTVLVDVTGLTPYTRYAYRFTALGDTSPVGRTQTAGTDAVHALRMAFVSCSNWTGGYFSAYRHVAERDDLDLVLHLGDYLYEYGNGPDEYRYGPPSLKGERDHEPSGEMVTLTDYRRRHAQYKTDPDLQAAHAAHPFVVIFDDHELADNAYDGGFVSEDGPPPVTYAERKRSAYQAYLEWMPIRLPDQTVPHQGIRFFRRLSFGPLADLTVVETRQNRDKQVASFGSDLTSVADPARVIMETEQMDWLVDGLTAPGPQWRLLGNQTVFTRVAFPKDLPGRDALVRLGIGATSFNTDQWDGYQDDQLQVLTAMAASPGQPVVLTGDIHSSWANDVPLDAGSYVPVEPVNNSVAVEFVCPSVTSDGFSEALGSEEAAVALTTGLQAANPHIRHLQGLSHGFGVLDVTPQAVQCDFWYLSDREDPRATIAPGSSWRSLAGTPSVVAAAGPVGPRSDSPRSGVRRAAAPGPAPTAEGAPEPVPVADQLPATGLTAPVSAGVAALAAGAVARVARRIGAAGEGR